MQSELDYNKQRHSKPLISLKNWLSVPLALAFSAVLYFQVINPVHKSVNFEAALSDNLLLELATLSPEEVEIVEDLDFIEALDKLSPEELEEVLL